MTHYLATGEGPLLGRRIEVEALHKAGYLLPIELAISPVETEAGTHFSAFVRDLTERRRQEDRLKLALVDAEDANEAKSCFLATMSHEIRSPLNALISMSGLLLETRLDNEQREFARIANEGGQNLLALINDILDFSRIESGQLELDERPVDLLEMTASVLDLFSLQAHTQGIALLGIYAPDVPSQLVGDELRLRQILTNLVGNAIKFTSAGGVLVSIRMSPEKHICIDVRDSGIGIPKERQGAVFEEFTQAEKAMRVTTVAVASGSPLSIA